MSLYSGQLPYFRLTRNYVNPITHRTNTLEILELRDGLCVQLPTLLTLELLLHDIIERKMVMFYHVDVILKPGKFQINREYYSISFHYNIHVINLVIEWDVQ